MNAPQKFTGKIQTWQPERGFGFILADDGKTKIFFHIKSLHSPHIEPKVGEAVQVIAEPDTKGLKAKVVSSPKRRAQTNQQSTNSKVQTTQKPSSQPKLRPNFQNQTLGKIVEWNDERGFGFIQTENFKEKIFFHVNDLPLNQGKFRPKQGETVLFTAKSDGKRWAATSVTSAQRQRIERVQQRRQAEREANLNSKAIMALLVAVIWLGLCAWRLPKLALIYGILSLILLAFYWKDKRAANEGEWRVPEANLHTWALLGGWCGGLLARYLFNHKTTKQEFVFVFWITVMANVGATIYFLPKLVELLK